MTPTTAFIAALLIAAACLAALLGITLAWRHRDRRHDKRGDWFAFKDDEDDHPNHF